jgi:hypothetical protein
MDGWNFLGTNSTGQLRVRLEAALLTVYLAGKVSKNATGVHDWRQDICALVESSLGGNVSDRIAFISPEEGQVDEMIPETVVGKDSYHIQSAGLVLVDASEKIGAGTAQEMVIAKYFSKPVLTILPKNTHHRKEVVIGGERLKDWRHPFIVTFSDYLVDDYAEAAQKLCAVALGTETHNASDIHVIDRCIALYRSRYVRNTSAEE